MGGISRRGFLRLCAGLVGAPLVGCSTPSATSQSHEIQTTLFAFDTVCTLGGIMEQDLLDEASALCEHFEQLFSRTIPESDVGRINAAQGEAVEVDPQTAELVRLALDYCEESGGLFDITIGAVSKLWDFSAGIVPSEQAILEALPHVGWEHVQVAENTVRLADPAARIDLGGIAKGYIADRVIDLFAKRDVTSAFVNLGGNVKVLGPKADGSPWTVGVRDPFDESGSAIVAKVTTAGGSLVTSGLYERTFEKNGQRYWHILDPRTGYPVETDVVSASIYSEESIDGDGYTKPLFMLERDEALAFVERHSRLQALLVFGDGSTATTHESDFAL